MREFKNKKARELFLESLRLEKIAVERQKEEIEESGVTMQSSELFTEAAGLRVLADDIEDGFIYEKDI